MGYRVRIDSEALASGLSGDEPFKERDDLGDLSLVLDCRELVSQWRLFGVFVITGAGIRDGD